MSVDLLDAMLKACREHPDAPAISQGRRTLTYRELDDRIASVAAALGAAGLRSGDRVLFSVRPSLDGICLALGVIAAGGTVVFADSGAGEEMFRARAALAAPRWVAAESLLYFASSGPLRPLARRRGLELPPYSAVVPDARHIYAGSWLPGVPRGSLRLRSLLAATGESTASGRVARAAGRVKNATDRIETRSEALIIFTSGTTAHPRAVVHSRTSLGTGLAGFAAHVRFAPGQRLLTDQLMIGIPGLIAGAHWRLPAFGADPGARPAHYLDVLPGTDALFLVPAALAALLTLLEEHPERAPELSTLLIGGAPVLRPLLERAKRCWPKARICAIYGMTEILPVAIADGDEKLAFTGPGDYVGTVLPTVHARIETNAAGDGELVLAGEGLALGYLADLPEHPLVSLSTGDLAELHGDRLVLRGRSKDMFIRGSTNVYPGLYEPVIAGIAGVADAAMVGVADEIGDDLIVLVIVPREGVPRGFGVTHPVITAVRAALPGLVDAAVLPDLVLIAADLPRAGRSSKLDRAALRDAVSRHLKSGS
ncbi:acyl--CoA ligase [Glaciihabitans sp. INWT7]|uniref:class I adenylate-forming enzyme family protein n=1 Tax=Glaciihabitans sp. INWT7 TaxID=2596912 RepID=UPI00162AAC98|nr:class I adenylate-forming enzyme family protein [Glaciihabitans sp. INWT7]QNE47669.1 acyl--CoA ligase [Glaciihabitans sp. INWT7]